MTRSLWLVPLLLLAACEVRTSPGPRNPSTRYEEGPPPPPRQPGPDRDRPARQWDSSGWTLLGEKTVDGTNDAEQVDFSQKMGAIPKRLTVTVTDSDLEMHDMKVVYTSGESFTPTGRHYFREGSRTRVIELSRAEILRAVQFKYSNLPGGGRARVQVWYQ
ncbi:MAG: hypothetical protein JWP01_3244 [Myxococcales bacterium]|nr:hypothetical protein [Myxococcales bacterium]